MARGFRPPLHKSDPRRSSRRREREQIEAPLSVIRFFPWRNDGLELGGELRKLVNAKLLFDSRHFIDHILEPVLAKKLVFLRGKRAACATLDRRYDHSVIRTVV